LKRRWSESRRAREALLSSLKLDPLPAGCAADEEVVGAVG
jgi:hypothetical protein